MKHNLTRRIQDAVTKVLRLGLGDESARRNAQQAREEFQGMSKGAIAEILIKRACRKTKWEGAMNGVGLTLCEGVLAAPAPEPTHKVLAGTSIAGLIVQDVSYTTRIQMQLLQEIAEVYGCPYHTEDEEDVWLVFEAALGLKGTERVGTYGRFLFTETARKQFRNLLRTGIRRVVQELVLKIAGPAVAKYFGEKYVMRLVPALNIFTGFAFNNRVTKAVGKWAKVKAKVRASAFNNIQVIRDSSPSLMIWVLPIIFYVGTADDRLRNNLLTLYSQSSKRLLLDDIECKRVEELIESESLLQVMERDVSDLDSPRAKKALYQIAITAAAVNLKPQNEHYECLEAWPKTALPTFFTC